MSIWAAYEAEMADYFDILKEEEGKNLNACGVNNFGQRMYRCKCGRMKLRYAVCECEMEDNNDACVML